MQRNFALAGPEGKTGPADDPFARTVRWTGDGDVERAVAALAGADLRCAHFADPAFFADEAQGMALCRLLRERVNLLWTARLAFVPGRELLRAMRMAGCQRVVIERGGGAAGDGVARLREFGFDYAFTAPGGEAERSEHAAYTVAEREAVAGELPGLHAVQFDLAVAYFNARRYGDVMRPLGKAMTLRFPANELCLNLLACLSAARHYPDVAAGLLTQADYGWPHPVVMRNRRLLRSWLESGGDVRGVRLVLEAEGGAVAAR